jgi:hypothetical protein
VGVEATVRAKEGESNKKTGGGGHNTELHDLYLSPYIVRVFKSRMRWTGYVAGIGEIRDA